MKRDGPSAVLPERGHFTFLLMSPVVWTATVMRRLQIPCGCFHPPLMTTLFRKHKTTNDMTPGLACVVSCAAQTCGG